MGKTGPTVRGLFLIIATCLAHPEDVEEDRRRRLSQDDPTAADCPLHQGCFITPCKFGQDCPDGFTEAFVVNRGLLATCDEECCCPKYCDPGEWGSSIGHGGCCYFAEHDEECGEGETHVAYTWSDRWWYKPKTCCKGAIFDACLENVLGLDGGAAGCGFRAHRETLDGCKARCALVDFRTTALTAGSTAATMLFLGMAVGAVGLGHVILPVVVVALGAVAIWGAYELHQTWALQEKACEFACTEWDLLVCNKGLYLGQANVTSSFNATVSRSAAEARAAELSPEIDDGWFGRFGQWMGDLMGDLFGLDDEYEEALREEAFLRHECHKCPAGTYQPAVGSTKANQQVYRYRCCTSQKIRCIPCARGRFGRVMGAESEDSCVACPAGTYGEDTQSSTKDSCVPCPAGRFGDQSATQNVEDCQLCAAGRYNSNEGSVRCEECPAGYYSSDLGAMSNATCKPCPEGTYGEKRNDQPLKDKGDCTPCPAGRHGGGTATLQSAGARSVDVCVLCAAGKYNADTGQKNESACIECEEGLTSREGSATPCSNCGEGKFAEDSSTCAECKKGHWCNGGSMIPCPPGHFNSNAGATEYEDCVPCAPGRVGLRFGLSSAEECTPCPQGKYGSKEGAMDDDDCMPCPPGTASTEVGRAGSATCQPCARGQYSMNAGSITCAQCEPGRYGPEEGGSAASSCLPCPRGTFLSGYGAKSESFCSKCPQGRYGNSEGVDDIADCEPCPAGRSSAVAGATDVSTCSRCANGTFSEPGAMACVKCKGGEYAVTTRDRCLGCVGGRYSSAGSDECTRCASGYYSAREAESCTACSAGKHGNESALARRSLEHASCVLCPVGRYSKLMGLASADDCNACPRGKSGTMIGSTSEIDGCRDCEEGSFAGKPASGTCESCPEGETSPKGASYCSVCKRGEFLSAETKTCVVCEAGTFKAIAGAGECERCPVDTFQPGEGETSCIPCPDGTGTHLAVGAISRTQCFTCSAGTLCNASFGSAAILALSSTSDTTSTSSGWFQHATIGLYRDPPLAETEATKSPPSTLFFACPFAPSCSGVDAEGVNSATCGASLANASMGCEGCAAGYNGALCMTCAKDYARKGKLECAPCSSGGAVVAAVLALILLVAAIVVYLIRNTIKSKGKAGDVRLAVCKATVSHLQLVSMASGFPLKWPSSLLVTFEIFEATSLAGGPGDVISIDCLFSSGSAFFMETTVTAIFPIVVVLCIVLFWTVVARRYWMMSRELSWHRSTMSVIIFIYLINISLVQKALELFVCTPELANGRRFFAADTRIGCWDDSHLRWVLSLGAPMLIIFGIGTPLVTLWVLRESHREGLDKRLEVYGFLYSSYAERRYYWEVVVLMRKELFAVSAVLLPSYAGVDVQTYCGLLIILFFLLVHVESEPYNHSAMNRVEKWGLITAFFTLYCGLFLFSDSTASWGKEMATVLIFVVNIGFLSFVAFILYHAEVGEPPEDDTPDSSSDSGTSADAWQIFALIPSRRKLVGFFRRSNSTRLPDFAEDTKVSTLHHSSTITEAELPQLSHDNPMHC